MVSLSALLSNAWDGDRLWLATVPFVLAVASLDRVQRVAAGPPGVSLTVSFPHAVTTLWAFLNVPATGGFDVSLPGLALLPAFALLTAALAGGYLGRIDADFEPGDRSFADGVRAFVVPLLGYELLRLLAVAALLPLAFAGPVAILVVLPVVLLLAYLFYATPFLVVTEGRGLVAALERSYGLATDGGEHLSYAVQYALVVLVGSVPASLLARNGGVPGVVLAAALLAPVGLALDGATMLFVRRRVHGTGVDGDGHAPGGPEPAVRRLDDPDSRDGRSE